MKHSKVSVEEQIATFMARKEKLFPEIMVQQVARTHAQQRGRRVRREFPSMKMTIKHMRVA